MARGGKKEVVLAARLKEARLAVGISQRELGIQSGMDPSVASPRINQYERGKHAPDTNTLSKLGQVLGMPVAYFFAEDDDLAVLIANFHRLTSKARKRLVTLSAKETRGSRG
ncbi:helix-turn-helix transcriptional regulator [Rhodanobacter sp. Root179]|jgi:transcriptional regulator with XRE-family HTH domain|uniref:helix-turn-helix domain-containing protein n=1 Tax=Rhodanobacter sp. Root179 TaxID=1736482 RepID=UPI0009EB18AD|nr:helix-turn-helix transcriptional regulator [Rhodanobacter sp. Root179]